MEKNKVEKPVQTSAQASKEQKSASLADVLPKEATVELGDKKITFKEFTVANLNKVYSVLANADLTKLLVGGGITPMSIMAAIEWNDLVKLLAISSGEPEETFLALSSVEDVLEVIGAFCRANFGFFVFNFKSIASTADLVEKAIPILNKALP